LHVASWESKGVRNCHVILFLALLSFVLELMFVIRDSRSFCFIFLNPLKEAIYNNNNSYFESTDLRGPV